MDKITIAKAIEILELNINEAKPPMPLDCRTSVQLALDVLAGLIAERAIYHYDRIGQLPHEEIEPKKG